MEEDGKTYSDLEEKIVVSGSQNAIPRYTNWSLAFSVHREAACLKRVTGDYLTGNKSRLMVYPMFTRRGDVHAWKLKFNITGLAVARVAELDIAMIE